MERARIAIRRGTSQIEIEGTEEFVDRHLPTLTDLLPSPGSVGDEEDGLDHIAVEEGHAPEQETDAGTETQRQSLRKFVEEKKPQNASEAIACVVYFLRKFRGKDEISADEMRQSLILAKHRPPTNFAQALTDCRRRYGYIEAGTKKELWKLSHDGEVTIELDLPRST
jgi:hypothetical protein